MRGVLTVNQVAAERKNRLSTELEGIRCGLTWDDERPNELWIGRRNGNSQLLPRDPALFESEGRTFANLPGGHAERYADIFEAFFWQ